MQEPERTNLLKATSYISPTRETSPAQEAALSFTRKTQHRDSPTKQTEWARKDLQKLNGKLLSPELDKGYSMLYFV
jgi:hypothetical protein